MRTKFLSIIAGILLASILSGCGGSSSSGQSVSTGVYKDAGIVSGLQYATPTQSGVTDSNGKFKYVAGETVTFSVSNVTIGQATGAPIVTTFDLVGITPPTSSFGIPTNNPTSKKFQEAINISLFLQTLDDDSDPTNGIAIPSVVNSVVAVTPLDFKITTNLLPGDAVQTWYNFQDSPQFKVFIGSCRAAGAWGGTKAIKQLGYAANRLYQGLGITPNVYLAERKMRSDASFVNYEYINSGLIYKQFNYSDLAILQRLVAYTYNTDGNVMRKDISTYVGDYSNTSQENAVYDANGNLISFFEIDPYGSQYEHFYDYDINGNVTKETRKQDGILLDYKVYNYNPNGTLLSRRDYNDTNQLNESFNYTYNDKLLVTSLEYTTGSVTSTLVQTYDQNHNIARITDFYGTTLRSQDFTYDSFGNPITYSFYLDGALEFKFVYTWDTNGYPVATKSYGADGQLSQSILGTYDSNGSLIKVTQTGGVTSSSTITYINQSGWGNLPGTTVDWLRTAN